MASQVASPPSLQTGPAPSVSTIRHKRNFKALKLPQTPRAAPSGDPDASATSNARGGLGLSLKPTLTTAPKNGPGSTSPSQVPPRPTGHHRTFKHASISSTIASLSLSNSEDLNASQGGGPGGVKLVDVRDEQFKKLEELGQGNGGSVMKVQHVPSRIIMAKKVVLIDAKPSIRKQIVRELQIMHDCHSPYIISFYSAYLSEPNVCICMEFMDKGSFDSIYKKLGRIDIKVVQKVAEAVLEGLVYLYEVHRIIHRDIKPSNILCNSQGQIKLCDFGVSGELVNSIANTFVGTSTYMSPERIQGADYTIKSDVWSLGITLIELAHGRFPFSDTSSDDEDEDENLSDVEEEATGGASGTPDEGASSTIRSKPSKSVATASHRDSLQVHSSRTRKHPPREPVNDFDVLSQPLPSPSPSLPRSPSQAQPSPSHLRPQSHLTVSRKKRRSKGVSLHGGKMMMSILELMHHIVQEPPPRLRPLRPRDRDSNASLSEVPIEAIEFVDACLEKDVERRKTPSSLINFDWIKTARDSDFDLKVWTSTF